MLESPTTVATGHMNVGGFYNITAARARPWSRVQEDPGHCGEILPDLDFVAARAALGQAGQRRQHASGHGRRDMKNEPRLPKVLKSRKASWPTWAAPAAS